MPGLHGHPLFKQLTQTLDDACFVTTTIPRLLCEYIGCIDIRSCSFQLLDIAGVDEHLKVQLSLNTTVSRRGFRFEFIRWRRCSVEVPNPFDLEFVTIGSAGTSRRRTVALTSVLPVMSLNSKKAAHV